MNNIESGEGGFQKKLLLKFLREEYQMSQPLLQLSVHSLFEMRNPPRQSVSKMFQNPNPG